MELTDDLINPDPELSDRRFVGPKGPNTDVDIYLIGEPR
jgi:hypothetical protein